MPQLRKLFYVPLEPYESRYTHQLENWSTAQFKALLREGQELVVVRGRPISAKVNIGQVLDAIGRPYFAMSQIQAILKMIENVEIGDQDFILFEDMFHPGIESLAYVFSQLRYARQDFRIPKIGMRCLAQTIDPDDFVHYTGMTSWMRHYEKMVNEFVDCLFVASTEMLGYIKAAGWQVPVFVTGLPYNKQAVIDSIDPKAYYLFQDRPMRVVFASRIAEEKQPNFLAQVANAIGTVYNQIYAPEKEIEFYVLSGTTIKFPTPYEAFNKAVALGHLQIYDNLTKQEYYNHLMQARVLFNCSLQDWVSNIASEADTFNCNLVFPAYRSFPEAFDNDKNRLYIPWSVTDAAKKLADALIVENYKTGHFSAKQNETNSITLSYINRMIRGE